MTSIPAAICKIFCNNFRRFYLKNRRLFLDILFHFWNVHKIYNNLKKTMSVLAQLFRKLLFPKEVATETSRRSCFRTPFGNQRVNGFQTQLKVARHHYYPSFPWILGKLSWKKTALLWSKILRLFANTLTPDDKYSCRNMQNARSSNAFISKTQDFSMISYSISEMCIKFRKFGKKGWVS